MSEYLLVCSGCPVWTRIFLSLQLRSCAAFRDSFSCPLSLWPGVTLLLLIEILPGLALMHLPPSVELPAALCLELSNFAGQYFYSCLQTLNCTFDPSAFPAGCLLSVPQVCSVLPFCSSSSSVCSCSVASVGGFAEHLQQNPFLWYPGISLLPAIKCLG